MIIKAIKLDTDGLPTGESIDLEVESFNFSPDNLAMVATPFRVTRIEDTPSSVTFLIEEDFLLIERMLNDESTHSD